MFYETLNRLCKEKGTTVTALVKSIGMSTGFPTAWKNGRQPRSDQLQRLAAALDVPVTALMSDSSPSVRTDFLTSPNGVRIPVLGRVAAGIPIEAITDVEDYEEISAAMAAGGEYIALTIHGESMEPKMSEGDVVIVRLQDTINNGEIAIVMVNGEDATCKKIKKTDAGLYLLSLNPAFEPIFYSAHEVETLPVRVLGKVVELRAKF